MVAAYQDIYKYLESVNQKPTLNVTDNEASKAVQNYIKSKDVDWQLVEPDNHRVNAAKRAIQTFKNHFSGWPRNCRQGIPPPTVVLSSHPSQNDPEHAPHVLR